MSGGDWLSLRGYGGTLNIPPLTTAVFPLMTMPDLGTYDSSLPFGGAAAETLRDFSPARIVGQVFRIRSLSSADTIWGWRLVELPWDFTAQAFDVPWPANAAVMSDPDYSDMVRWYVERFYEEDGVAVLAGVTPLHHPWWTFVDLQVKTLWGMHSGVWPGLLVDNSSSEEDLGISHRLRAFGYSR